MNRKRFLQKFAISTGGIIVAPHFMSAQNKMPKGDPLPADKVKEFVGAGHNNMVRIKEMLTETPTLLYATWDWGGGDFETA